jgi:hypothetical protein
MDQKYNDQKGATQYAGKQLKVSESHRRQMLGKTSYEGYDHGSTRPGRYQALDRYKDYTNNSYIYNLRDSKTKGVPPTGSQLINQYIQMG